MKKYLPRSLNNPNGFTLIELMVVISIIAFLSVIGIVAFTNAQKTARDGRRRADVEAIAAALESNRDGIGGKYLPAGLSIVSATGTDATFDGYFSNGKAPKDPVNDSTYYYKVSIPAATSNISFKVCARLEGTANGNATDLDAGGLGATTGGFFCKVNQQ